MSDMTSAAAQKPKKSVALSGVIAGNTALSSVGRTGNDLHYRGYDILDIADQCEYEEIAHLLVHGKLPTRAELARYKRKLASMRGLPAVVQDVLEALPAAAHPMDVMRTGVSALGTTLPERDAHDTPGARDIADRLIASLGSMLCYWYHASHNGRLIDVETDDDSVGAHFLHLLHGEAPQASWVRAMHTSLNLYAEHEFNASTFTARVIAGTGSDLYSCIAGDDARGERRCVEFVLGIEVERRVHRTHPGSLRRFAVQQVQEMRADRIVVGLDVDQAAVVARVIPVAQHRAQRGDQAVGDVARARGVVCIPCRQCRAERGNAGAHHVHRVCGRGQRFEDILHDGGQSAHRCELALVARELGARRQLAVHEQVRDLLVFALVGDVEDVAVSY